MSTFGIQVFDHSGNEIFGSGDGTFFILGVLNTNKQSSGAFSVSVPFGNLIAYIDGRTFAGVSSLEEPILSVTDNSNIEWANFKNGVNFEIIYGVCDING